MDGKWWLLASHAAAAVGGAALAVRLTHPEAPPPPPPPPLPAPAPGPPPEEDGGLEDMEAIAWAGKEAMLLPCHSHFRVYCVVVYEQPDGHLAYLTGTNCEFSPYIGGALCAERVALSKLCETPHKRVVELYIVTDNAQCLTPGLLCREFMSGYLDPTTAIHLYGTETRLTTTLAQLHPHPCLYATVDRDRVLAFAKEFAGRMETPTAPQAAELYEAAQSATKYDDTDNIYPMRYAAGVLFDDGSIEVGWQSKAMEYGNTLDAVTKLMHTLQTSRLADPPRLPQLLMHVDHCGVLHAPFAQARTLLTEHGFGALPCQLHDSTGSLCTATLAELAPDGCAMF